MAPPANTVTILKAGNLPSALEARSGGYPGLIQAMLGPGFACRTLDIREDLPSAADTAVDALILTGSDASVYEPHDWIQRLLPWLRAVDPATPTIGICFGHQALACAFGGHVEKMAEGARAGHERYWLTEVEEDAVGADIVLPAWHYDHVSVAPPTALRLAGNAHCPNALLAYRNRCTISFQCHPEFPVQLIPPLVEAWRDLDILDAEGARRSLESIHQPSDSARIAGWIRSIIRHKRVDPLGERLA